MLHSLINLMKQDFFYQEFRFYTTILKNKVEKVKLVGLKKLLPDSI